MLITSHKILLFSAFGDIYSVLGTDYEQYASVYSCEVKFDVKVEYGWVLTREKEPSDLRFKITKMKF